MKKLLTLLLALALVFSLTACVTAPAADTTESTAPVGTTDPDLTPSSPLLYKVSTPEGGTVWLLGSVHVGIHQMYPLPDYVMNAYAEAQALAVECDVVAAEEDLEGSMNALTGLLYQGNTKISDRIPAELYLNALDILQENKVYMRALDYYKPVMWFSFVDSCSYYKYGYDVNNGIDVHLLNQAKDDGKEIREIESVAFQYGMLASFSEELQILLLEEAVANYHSEEAQQAMDSLLKAWCEGDEQTLTGLLFTDEAPTDANEEKLLTEYTTAMVTNRNISMANYAEKILKNGEKVFICVGMGHILGEGGVVDLLTQRGYTAELVK